MNVLPCGICGQAHPPNACRVRPQAGLAQQQTQLLQQQLQAYDTSIQPNGMPRGGYYAQQLLSQTGYPHSSNGANNPYAQLQTQQQQQQQQLQHQQLLRHPQLQYQQYQQHPLSYSQPPPHQPPQQYGYQTYPSGGYAQPPPQQPPAHQPPQQQQQQQPQGYAPGSASSVQFTAVQHVPRMQKQQLPKMVPQQQPQQPLGSASSLSTSGTPANSPTTPSAMEKRLDASAPSFYPKGDPGAASTSSASAGSASSASASAPAAPATSGKYVPPRKRAEVLEDREVVKDAEPPEGGGGKKLRHLWDSDLTGVVVSVSPDSSTAEIECPEVREVVATTVSMHTADCRGFSHPKTGMRVTFRLSTGGKSVATASCVVLEDSMVSPQRFLGVVESFNTEKHEGFIRPSSEARLRYNTPLLLFASAAGDGQFVKGTRVSFRVKRDKDSTVTARDVIVLPMSLDEISAPPLESTEAIDMLPPLPGQHPWELDFVLFHSSCWDGLCAAYAIYNAAGSHRDDIVYIAVNSTAEEGNIPDLEGKNIALVDVAFSVPKMAEMARITASMVVIDHHTTSAGINCSEFSELVRFDLRHSAATLAWEFCRLAVQSGPSWLDVEHDKIPRFLALTGEVDLGRFGHDHPVARRWAIGIEVFSLHPNFSGGGTLTLPRHTNNRFPGAASQEKFVLNTLERLHDYVKKGDEVVDRILQIGEEAEVALEDQVSHWMTQVQMKRFKKAPDLLVAVVVLTSDPQRQIHSAPIPYKFARNELGHRLSRMDGVHCGVVVAGRAVMLRCDAGTDVSELAKKYGGGGHTTAAAFQLEDDAASCSYLFLEEE